MEFVDDSPPFLHGRGFRGGFRKGDQSLVLFFLEFADVTENAGQEDKIKASNDDRIDSIGDPIASAAREIRITAYMRNPAIATGMLPLMPHRKLAVITGKE